MKRGILFSILFLCFLQSNFAQTIDTINFEINASRAEIDTSNQSNVWQIGKPSKVVFDSAFSLNKAIVTDTLVQYPMGVNSSFKVGFVLTGQQPVISFKYKMDSDSGKDGGYVDVSFDNGQNWELLTAQTNHPGNGGMVGGNFGMYTNSFYDTVDTLYNGQPGFSGQTNGWKQASIQFPCFAVKMGFTFWVRFTFISDSIQTTNDGWMIDDIVIDNTGICSEVDELQNNKISVSIYPNPISNSSVVTIKNGDIKNAVFEVFDVTGKRYFASETLIAIVSGLIEVI
jgi:hypothetical protein